MNNTTRRDFLGTAALAVGGVLAGHADAPADAKFYRGALLHLGSNMWGDFPGDPDALAKSEEEEKTKPTPVTPTGKSTNYRNYVRCRDDLWRKTTDYAVKKGMNMIVIDVGEGVVYPSHPELAIDGSWSPDKLRAEVRRLRAMGVEAIPKLNFSK